MNDPIERLNVLSKWHFGVAIIAIPVSLLGPILLLSGATEFEESAKVAVIMAAVGGQIGCLLIIGGIAFLGRALRVRKSWMSCFVLSVVFLLLFPVGTILSIATLRALNRPDVRALFKGADHGPQTTDNRPEEG